MRLGALFSGGKDSTLAIHEAVGAGHRVCCLMTVHPDSAESPLLHHPGTHVARLQARSLGLPWYGRAAPSVDMDAESRTLDMLVEEATRDHRIEGLVHGGLRSGFQRRVFADLCDRHSLEAVAPLWGRGDGYLHDVIGAGIRFVVVGVSAGGLDGSWLGRTITHQDADRLESLAASHGLAADFEGGEAETLVVDCPLFKYGIVLCGHPVWDGYRGVLEIRGASPLRGSFALSRGGP